MNVLFINSFDCSPMASGGVNRVVYLLSRYFMDKYSIGCFLGFYEDQPSRPLADFSGRIKLSRNFDEHEFESFIVDNRIDVVQINFLKKENLHTIPLMYAIAKKHNVKFLYCLHVCPGFETVTYGSWAKVKYSLTHHEDVRNDLHRWLISITKPLVQPISYRLIRDKYRIPYQNCDKVVLLSKFYKEPYAKIAGVSDLSKFEAIGNVLTFNEYISEEEVGKKRKEVIVVARLDEFSKRISLALKVWREVEKNPQLDDWVFTIVGNGEGFNFYQELVKKWHLKRVTFTGHQQPVEYYRRASIFLMTSSAEGWPMVLMEASQMGVATVALDSFGALHDIVEDGYNGCIVPNNDLTAFYHALVNIMLDDDKRLAMCKNAVQNCKKFEISKIVDKWQFLYNNI